MSFMIRCLTTRIRADMAAALVALAAAALPLQAHAQPTQKPAAQKPAAAAAKPKPAAAASKAAPAAAKPAASGPVQVASFGDWGVYVSETPKGKVCYALAQPKERLPKTLKRDPAYVFISTRPQEGVRNEVSVVLGFAARDGSEGSATIGGSGFALVTKGNAAWVKNAAEDASFVEALKKGQSLTVKATSKRGNESTDRYNLSGAAQALDRVRKECS